MQHDDMIWSSVNQHFCSFKAKTAKQTFCRNVYNLTGLCSRMACPLANSRYATIVEDDGKLLLYVKTVERAHSPRNLWEKIRLSSNYRAALAQIDKHLAFWPAFYVHKAKQRLTKMTQYLIRRRKLETRTKTRLVGVKKKVEKREVGRERKAVKAAALEKAIEKELLGRLRAGTYGDIYNFPTKQYEKALDEEMEEEEDDEEEEEELTGDEYEAQYEADDSEEEVADMEDGGGAFRDGEEFDFDDSDDDAEDDDADESDGEDESDSGAETGDVDELVRARAKLRAKLKKKKKAGARKGRKAVRHRGGVSVEMEYENETTADAVRQVE